MDANEIVGLVDDGGRNLPVERGSGHVHILSQDPAFRSRNRTNIKNQISHLWYVRDDTGIVRVTVHQLDTEAFGFGNDLSKREFHALLPPTQHKPDTYRNSQRNPADGFLLASIDGRTLDRAGHGEVLSERGRGRSQKGDGDGDELHWLVKYAGTSAYAGREKFLWKRKMTKSIEIWTVLQTQFSDVPD